MGNNQKSDNVKSAVLESLVIWSCNASAQDELSRSEQTRCLLLNRHEHNRIEFVFPLCNQGFYPRLSSTTKDIPCRFLHRPSVDFFRHLRIDHMKSVWPLPPTGK